MRLHRLIVVVLLLSIFLSACTTKIIVPKDSGQSDVLQITGASELEAAPDIAILSFGVVTKSFDARKAQAENSAISNSIRDALLSAGLDSDDIETSSYSLVKVTRWDQDARRQVDDGYSVTNTVSVKIRDVEMVGKIIDLAVSAGANDVGGVRFVLSPEKERELKMKALRQAVSDAREKAVAIAQSAQISLGGVSNVIEQNFYVQPYAVSADRLAVAESAPTPISPQSVKVSARVSVSFDID
ncbi:DUF541 domain-containing protein [Candidatus Woesearchaeota archaeon]|nr:MAG: DUF541 domain-containing protein [Candidatus Woesearchaeota archaeon]